MVYQRLHGGRTVISMRMKPEIKEAFARRCKQIGLSTCHVAEGLFQAWLVGVSERVELVNHSPTMNVTLVRDVKRVRRYTREVFEEEAEIESREISSGGCAVCKKPTYVVATRFDKSRVPLCREHFGKEKSKLMGWRAVQ